MLIFIYEECSIEIEFSVQCKSDRNVEFLLGDGWGLDSARLLPTSSPSAKFLFFLSTVESWGVRRRDGSQISDPITRAE